MQKTLEQEIEVVVKELLIAFGKNPKYEKDRINVYVNRIVNYYELLDFPHLEETCEVLEFTMNYMPTLNEIADCYDFLHWCKDEGLDSKKQRINRYRLYLDDSKNNPIKGQFRLSKYRSYYKEGW